MRLLLTLGVVFVVASVRPAALIPLLTDADVARALGVARASDAERAAYHAPYIIATDDPLVDRLEIVTEFRRFVLAAEEQLQMGNWMAGRGGTDEKGRTLRDILRPSRGQVSVRVRFRFHPQNTYVNLPIIDILLGQPTLLAISTTATPFLGPQPTDDPAARPAVLGGSVETFFNAPSIGSQALPVRVVMDGHELVRHPFDFRSVE